jgi:phage terminase large subunit-like protein
MTLSSSYISDVTAGRIKVCKWVRLAVERHLRDLKTAKSRGLKFDEAAGERAVRFFSLLKHYKGKYQGQPFQLLPWQAFFISTLFGWKRSDGTRRFRYGYLKVSRKNGKTTLAAGICLYGLIADGENAAEVYTAATTRDQASLAFKDAMQMVEADPNLKSVVSIWKNSLTVESNASFLKPVSSDAGNLDGLNPHIALIDEYHAHRDDQVFNVMKSAMGSRTQPLHLTITTAGFNRTSSCYTYEKTCQEILKGIKEDDSQFALMFDIDEEDDYLDETVWIKANPSLGHTPSVEFLRQEVIQAQNNPTQLVNLLTKNFNRWTDASRTWIEDAKWQACRMPEDIDLDYLHSLTCFAAIDLASTKDLNSVTKIWIDPDQMRYYTKTKYYLPEESMLARVKRDRVRYDIWVDEGWITLTSGNVTDYRYIKNDILTDCENFQLAGIAFDRWNSSQLVIDLVDELGKDLMVPYGQGFASMSAPSKEFETLIYQTHLLHDGNPVTRWMLGNVELSTDPAGNIKPDKAKSTEKIDGIVSTIMALGLIMVNKMQLAEQGTSRYDTEEGGLWVI